MSKKDKHERRELYQNLAFTIVSSLLAALAANGRTWKQVNEKAGWREGTAEEMLIKLMHLKEIGLREIALLAYGCDCEIRFALEDA